MSIFLSVGESSSSFSSETLELFHEISSSAAAVVGQIPVAGEFTTTQALSRSLSAPAPSGLTSTAGRRRATSTEAIPITCLVPEFSNEPLEFMDISEGKVQNLGNFTTLSSILPCRFRGGGVVGGGLHVQKWSVEEKLVVWNTYSHGKGGPRALASKIFLKEVQNGEF